MFQDEKEKKKKKHNHPVTGKNFTPVGEFVCF